ncbi:putative anti-sigma regulatory factor, serine/threonine protein kinase [Beutenbergia cavernae DSM 12333]|uniref:Putative anti-sigma regulatory factor, serine/threonine protein kinase n=1 Tax=Beutenbergia cavernae (strain ATCC BAA-8 / DSM 12333 / CCUG 43141 / JCM 11478 / NBRC 16432 / NCIMB 13614 / HKI 0122) TaxID=471853 RepID=C5C5D5_BEUC1|nr:ATP-binding protein [Beutenbergia cavernae]ACQ82275.1 putative anti-sigma regulatory factor, serine/threonine protein kinase [Beutenbergia cavernae DSM 12333]
MHEERDIESEPAAIAPARHWAEDHFAGAGLAERDRDLLVLLVSEVVTNAVLHAQPPVHLTIDITAERTRVEVTDGARVVPILRNPGPDEFNGRGIALVDAIATTWGTIMHPDGAKTVWFELRQPAPAVA